MTKQIPIKLLDSTGMVQLCVLTVAMHCPWFMEVNLTGFSKQRFEANDLFDCLCQLRKHVERLGFRVLCAGSRIDAHPSRMSRDMGGARKVYILKNREQARPENLVDIFAEITAEQAGTVEEQQTYYRKWLASLG